MSATLHAEDGSAPARRPSKAQFVVRVGLSIAMLLGSIYALVVKGAWLAAVMIAFWVVDVSTVVRHARAYGAS